MAKLQQTQLQHRARPQGALPSSLSNTGGGTKKAEYNENGAWLAAAVRATFPDRTVDSGPFRDKKFGNQKKSKIRQLLEMCFVNIFHYVPFLGLHELTVTTCVVPSKPKKGQVRDKNTSPKVVES